MISLSDGTEYSGWQEAFVRVCIALAREGRLSRELIPRGIISTNPNLRCPHCNSNCYFTGHDLDCGKLYETATAKFCANCEKIEIITEEANYATYEPKKVLELLKLKISQTFPTVVDTSRPCPVCGNGTYTYSKDLGAIDYYDNFWTICANPFCDWPGAHQENFEWGPYADSGGPRVWVSDIRRFQTVFISYNTLDEEFATMLFEKLIASGVSCWYAPHHLRGGSTIREQLQSAVRKVERLLLVLSDNSMKSEWVAYEISQAKDRERQESRRVLFPISLTQYKNIENWVLEDDKTPDLAKELRKYYIPDFSPWRDASKFQVEFDKLLDALKMQ